MGLAARLLFGLYGLAFLLAQWLPERPPDFLDDQLAHAALYYGLALALWPLLPATDPLARAAAVLSIGFLLAVVMEAGQAGLPHRSRDSLDTAADLAGLMGAVIPMAWAGLHPVRGIKAPGRATEAS